MLQVISGLDRAARLAGYRRRELGYLRHAPGDDRVDICTGINLDEAPDSLTFR
jgi:hypothetical protein